MPEELETQFQQTVEFVKNWTTGGKKVTSDEKLTCYGLYKQATIGNVNTERPSMFNFVEKSKWDAWKSREGMSKEQAMQEYIKEVDAQRAKYGE